jgi:uncharacterized membrane protein
MPVLAASHIILALAAMIAGLLVLRASKRTRWHRRVGWAYVGSMVGLNATALCIYRLNGRFGPFHVAAVLSRLGTAI